MYRLYLYKTTGISSAAPCILTTNMALAGEFSVWKSNNIESYMGEFDTVKIRTEIENSIDEKYKNRYKVIIEETPYKKIKYICILAQKDAVTGVIGKTVTVASENGLVLYDAIKKRYFHYSDICDIDYLAIRRRIETLNKLITTQMKPIYKIRKLSAFYGEAHKIADYVIILRKRRDKSLEEQVLDFYNLLSGAVTEGEKLLTDNRCFTVKSKYYQISYTLEAYSKHTDRIAYIKDNRPCVELMYRMGCNEAFKWAEKNMDCEYGYCMYKNEMMNAFKNPADRFVKGINIKKQIQREKFCMDYCGSFGGAIDFRAYTTYKRCSVEDKSTLAIDGCDVMPLLDIIEKFYPYIYERFYETSYLPEEMMEDIITKMKEVRDLIINDTYNEELKTYIKDIKCFSYLDHNYSGDENWIEFLHKHRYEAVRIYDVFIDWVKVQWETYGYRCNGLMFEVTGP